MNLTIDTEDGSVNFNNVPIPEYERKRIEQRALRQQKERDFLKAIREEKDSLSSFYIPETDEEREEKVPSLSSAELTEIRFRAFQALRNARGVFSVQLPSLSDYFQNRVPKEMSDWPIGHPSAFEVTACLQPIIIANTFITTSYLQEQMQKRGAFMVRVQENTDSRLWDLVFLLDSKFYCNVTVWSSGGIPEVVQEIFIKERQRLEESLKRNENFMDPAKRVRYVQEQDEMEMVRGLITEEEEEEDFEEERLNNEERDAKSAAFRLASVTIQIGSFSLYMVGI